MFDFFSTKDAIQYASAFNLEAEVRELICNLGYTPSDALSFFGIC